MANPETTEPLMTEAKLRFMCEQLRDWGGLPEDEVQRIYEAEMKRLGLQHMPSEPTTTPDRSGLAALHAVMLIASVGGFVTILLMVWP
jgi:chemotaxis response regulator CheB